jgi:hypothetical protein
MFKKITSFTAVALALGFLTSVSYGQLLGLYEFDGGGDGTSWDDANNWEQFTDAEGDPLCGNPATPPDAVTSADIPLAGVVIDNTMPGQTALDVNIGTAAGAGALSMSGGDLLGGRDLFVGRDAVNSNAGIMGLSGGTLDFGDDITVGAGSVGTMTMSNGAASTGDDFFVNVDSSFTMTGGTLFVGDKLVTEDNGIVNVDGGDVVADDDFYFFGASQITVDSGSMIVQDKLRFDEVLTTGKLTINNGLVRSQEFGYCSTADCSTSYVMNGTLEINGSGIYQSQQPTSPTSPVSQLTVAHAKELIADGTIITSEVAPLQLGVTTVIVPDFFGNTNLQFTQISIVPEPTSMLLLSLGSLGLLLRRKRTR